jgi:hypothetical protein
MLTYEDIYEEVFNSSEGLVYHECSYYEIAEFSTPAAVSDCPILITGTQISTANSRIYREGGFSNDVLRMAVHFIRLLCI